MNYKVVPAPVSIRSSGKKALEQGAKAYADIINQEAKSGWVFVCFDSTTIHTAVLGCFSQQVVEMKLLVFSKS